MAEVTIRKCPTGFELNLSFLHRNTLFTQLDAKMKKGYRLQWGTLSCDKKDIQVFSLHYSIFKLWIILSMIAMYPTIVSRLANVLSSFIFQ